MNHLLNICNINGAEVEPVDIITFGSPCQDLSVAGKRAGIQDGERSNLFFEAVRIIKEMRDATNNEYPKYAVWENVPGAFSSNKGHDFHAVLEALCSVCDDTVSIPRPYDAKRTRLVWNNAGEIVGNGYSIAWRTLDAQYWGVPQRRKRIYLVADFTGGRAREILFKPDSLRGNSTQGNEAGQGVASDAVGSVDGGAGAISVDASQADDVVRCEATVPSMQASQYKGGNCVAYSFDSLSSNSMKSSNPISSCRAVDVAKCIDTTYPDPSKNQGGIAVVQPVSALQANGIDRADTAGCNGCGWRENEMYTLNTIDRHAVCFENHQHGGYREGCGTLRASGGDYGGGSENVVCYDARGNGDAETVLFEPRSPDGEPRVYGDICPTLNTAQRGQRQPCIVENSKPPRRYIIRRLTPTECARLQGFPDWWSTLAPYDPADAEFWEDVRKTHAEITGKTYKPTKNLKKWYEGLHTDSAEYKMWGNGIALPNAIYVMQGIAEQGTKTLGSLFDGSGGFPLAGVLNGIEPLWASEVEPYPIAVTKSRFKEVEE